MRCSLLHKNVFKGLVELVLSVLFVALGFISLGEKRSVIG